MSARPYGLFFPRIRPELLPETWMDTEWLPENLLSVRVRTIAALCSS